MSPSHHGRHDEQDLFGAFFLAYGQDRNLHLCAESDKDDIRESQGGSVRCKDPQGVSDQVGERPQVKLSIPLQDR